jgi:hypothetical protein
VSSWLRSRFLRSMSLVSSRRKNNCQPNYWTPGTVTPDPTVSCGPYSAKVAPDGETRKEMFAECHRHNFIV